MERVVVPEILDGLPAENPDAKRSRADLVWINRLMGNEQWVLRQVAGHPAAAAEGIVEIGAGGGGLASRLARHGPVTAVDLGPRPLGLDEGVEWRREDLLDGKWSGGVLVANLILHHFEDDDLRRIGELALGFRVLLLVEPWRHPLSLALAGALVPFVGRVTKHDMPASIRAGFRSGELGRLLGVESKLEIRERSSWRGGHRVLGLRR